ncbi:heme-binding protein [Bacillus sp. ISL-75]|uniref:GlcG/HbpS family heme-binding protein n=1 Tax=Bacillus sp. ISL-75 TaxID=2819137 RepID=UPI001BE67AC1|nr:heme-binding protein [Bacillus sp. ISL-75]MBT2730177.1 heme-binding protein [Bacillus sp. ISL-75]
MEKVNKTVESSNISLALANKMLEKAIKKAEELGLPFSISIMDSTGYLKAFAAMDGAPVLSLEIAQNKAFSAATYRRATHEWYDRIKDDPPLLHGIVHTPRLIIFGGGYPIKINNQVVGGIGVSGGHYSQDMQVCESALEWIKTI